ncbi:MAG: phage portal protein [Firmicutes bacterium]|nr:phage portal protein [Bacillota bacterium]
MIIDEKFFEGGITPRIVGKLISRHQNEVGRFKYLMSYYLGNHPIKERERISDSASNNKIVCNHAKYIVDITKSYLLGNPITYSCDSDYDINPIKEAYVVQDMASIDNALEKQMSIYGKSYELLYIDEYSMPKSICLSPVNTFVVYSPLVDRVPLFGVHYFEKRDLDGNTSGVQCMVCDKDSVYVFENETSNYFDMELTGKYCHYFSDIPIIEYRNNEEEQGDFEQLISLIDAYNMLESDRVNDKEQFVDSFLFLSGMELDSEQAKKLKEERILLGYEDSDAKYLSKVMSESDIQVLADNLRKDICRFSMVPDLLDAQFGSNLSGVAIKYKLIGFEQQVKNKERYFSKALKKRFELYKNYFCLKGCMEDVPLHKVEISFTRNMPTNELEVSQMIKNLYGIASDKTLLSQLAFVSDPENEVRQAVEEQRERSVILPSDNEARDTNSGDTKNV